jgi:hypothetical protein
MKIIWNKWKLDKNGDPTDVILKSGSINGKSFTKIWKECLKEADKYVKTNFPNV